MTRRVLELLSTHGCDLEAVGREADVSVAELGARDARVGYDQLERLLEHAAARLGAARLSIELAPIRDEDTYGDAGLVLLAGPTFGQGLSRALQYQRLWGDGDRFRLHRSADGGGVLRFAHPGPSALARAVLAELAFLETMLAARTLVDPSARPSSVRFVHAPLGPIGPLADALGVAPVFGARANELALSSAVLDAPIRLPEGMLSAVLERRARDALRALPSAPSIAGRVRAICGEAPRALVLGVDAVARRLRMSPRTLQRKLRDEGTTFVEVIDGLRRERVAELAARGLPAKEIAFLVGYADPSALARARARWQRA